MNSAAHDFSGNWEREPSGVPFDAPNPDRPRQRLMTSPFWASQCWMPDKPPKPREFMVDGWISRGSAALLAGEGGTGKSLLGQMMASCVALGRPFMGAATTEAHAAYITCEDDENELHHRQLAINRALGVTMKDYGDYLTIYSRKGLLNHFLGVFDENGAIAPTEFHDEILTPFGGIGASFVVIDNATHTFPGNEIVRREVAAFGNLLDRAAMALNGAVVLIAHTAKVAGSEYSGSTGWDAHVRQRLFLAHAGADDPDERILRRSKANYARRGDEIRFRWHDGAFVRDNDLPEDRRAEVAIVARDGADNEVFLTCLAEMTRQERNVSEKRSASFAPSVFAKMSESKGIGKVRLEGAMDRLFRLGQIKRDTLPWKRDRKEIEGLIDAR